MPPRQLLQLFENFLGENWSLLNFSNIIYNDHRLYNKNLKWNWTYPFCDAAKNYSIHLIYSDNDFQKFYYETSLRFLPRILPIIIPIFKLVC